MPTPKNEKTASADKNPGRDRDKKTIAVGHKFGKISLEIMRQFEAPNACRSEERRVGKEC